ncbi:MAG: hypothetical protein ACOCM4_09600 [Acetivibrio ethanolgignens]
MMRKERKEEKLRALQAELDHRPEVERKAIQLIAECKFKEANKLLNTI